MNKLYERLYGKTVKDYPRGHIQSNGVDLHPDDDKEGILKRLAKTIEMLAAQFRSDKPIPVIASTHAIGRAIEPEQLMYIVETKLNSMASDPIHDGIRLGCCARNTHRTLQRAFVGFALGMLYGISQQQYSDARNETAIETAKKVAAQIDDDQLLIGQFI